MNEHLQVNYKISCKSNHCTGNTITNKLDVTFIIKL